MPSKSMIACPKCRTGRKGWGATNCNKCGTPELDFGTRVTLPKKSNDSAWARIESGDIFWDDKKVSKNPRPREWMLNHVVWNSPEWKKKQADRLISLWS